MADFAGDMCLWLLFVEESDVSFPLHIASFWTFFWLLRHAFRFLSATLAMLLLPASGARHSAL